MELPGHVAVLLEKTDCFAGGGGFEPLLSLFDIVRGGRYLVQNSGAFGRNAHGHSPRKRSVLFIRKRQFSRAH
jgi:hypothetical protein